MAIDAADLATIRNDVGTEPDDDTVEAFLDAEATTTLAALAIWRQRYADAISEPQSQSLAGDASHNWGQALEHMRTRIAVLENRAAVEAGDVAGVTSVAFGRSDRDRLYG